MLLKSISIENFRQFQNNRKIDFSEDLTKNVTIIMGDNGSGKTTFAQAFTWCLYGNTDFEDKLIINRVTAGEMRPGRQETVSVKLELVHNGTEYTILREQEYTKDNNGKIKGMPQKLSISYKDKGGTKFVPELETEGCIKRILPEELAKYFFFDGERINLMSKEIQKGRSKTFADAVQGLLGLDAFIKAIEHLKPTSKKSVIGKYDDDYDDDSNGKITHLTREIEEKNEKRESILADIHHIEEGLENNENRINELNKLLAEKEDSKIYQERKNQLSSQVAAKLENRNRLIGVMLKGFNLNGQAFFAKKMTKDVLTVLSKTDFFDKDIPELHAKTIDYILKHNKCICGTDITAGDEHYNCLVDLLKYIPPQSIGVTVGKFVNECESKARNSADLFADYSENYSLVRNYDIEIQDLHAQIEAIEIKIESLKDVGHWQTELNNCRALKETNTQKRDALLKRLGEIETEIKQKEASRSELTLKNDNNRRIETYKAYATYMYELLSETYAANEEKIRTKLQKTINEIFEEIYDGGLSLSIDEKYNIQVNVEDYDQYSDNVETSTAQSLSVIFAFITGIIKLAKESRNNVQTEEDELLESEPYPLIMDAPLSAFDTKRIKTICNVLPGIAEQVIIFIKDTDGQLAESNMTGKIGARYKFMKHNEFITSIEEE